MHGVASKWGREGQEMEAQNQEIKKNGRGHLGVYVSRLYKG